MVMTDGDNIPDTDFCDGDDWDYEDEDDDPRGHSESCTCEHCSQNYPERVYDDDCEDEENRIICPKCNCAILEDEFSETQGMCIYCLNELDGW